MKNIELIEKIETYINSLGNIGLKEGIRWRSIFTEEDREAKELFRRFIENENLVASEDAIGNVYGKLKNSVDYGDVKKILVGSHIDTVRDGGAYDGAAGMIIGLLAVSENIKKYGNPVIPVEVIALTEEEGSRYAMSYVGSRAIVNGLNENELNSVDDDGINFKTAMLQAGYDPDKVNQAKRDDIHSYFEVHIEQGPVLERTGKKIGIVERINGIFFLEVEIIGREDHAGTTPMNMRRDSLVAASKIIARLPEVIAEISESATATVGKIRVEPGSSNVVPKKTIFTIDFRDMDADKLILMNRTIQFELDQLENQGYKVKHNLTTNELPIDLDRELVDLCEKTVRDMGVPYQKMNSGAGHDAQIFAERFPSSLLFIPCKGGRSHSPVEYASNEDIAIAVEVMSGILKKLAW
ncbi:MAG: Zn-dependent hydrolase [Dethiosulfatibacter sp.]|nr:Zn-dependent hydrolase [Dethiosulfatibacter sp.]